MIERVLVANRGEIARRVFRTCREMGVSTVAVCADPDAELPYVAEADVAVRLPGSAAPETYLRAELLLAAAAHSGADAVHPGYGFLSEDAGFARAVLDAGLAWIGPPPEAIELMGSKIEAKKVMAGAGVPVLDELDASLVTEADLPVLIKASAGGGGRGMRVVRHLADLPGELAAARSEAAAAFGDGTVFCEPYVENGRHVEVQILADAHGTVLALGERECSIQRRYQKVLEETPSPAVDASLRSKLCEAARSAALTVDYVGAGTVEFLLAADGRFFFLEMNTRLQVEHPVTECVTGLDLVAWQLRIAEGERLFDHPPEPYGHAIEVRLYAESVDGDTWRPQSGPLHALEFPGVDHEFTSPRKSGPAAVLRVDAGYAAGSVVGVTFDPMLAKVIGWAPTRAGAARRVAAALAGARIHGVATNRDLLIRILRHPSFASGETDTGFFGRHGLAGLAVPLADRRAEELSALAAALADAEARRPPGVLGGLPSGWRNVVSAPQRKTYTAPSGEIEVAYRFTRAGLEASGGQLVSVAPGHVVLEVSGVRHRFTVADYGEVVCVDSSLGSVALRPVPRFPVASAEEAPGSLLAPMPGTVTRIAVAAGGLAEVGKPLMWLEAMKMEHEIAAPATGVVELRVKPGQQVEVGQVLAIINAEGS